jgi:hypothetical protein
MRRVLIAAITLIPLLILLVLSASGLRAETSWRAGIGYDLLSQQYFLDSVVSEGADTVLADWSLQTDYFNDVKGLISGRYRPYDDDRVDFSGRYEQTDDFLRLRLAEYSRLEFSGHKLYFSGEWEIKSRVGDSAEFGDDYWRAYGQTRYSFPLTDKLNWKTQVRGEYTDFASGSATSYDHGRITVKTGLESLFAGFSFAQMDLFISSRNVPANNDLSYTSFGMEGSLWWLLGAADLDVMGRLERKDYSAPFNEDDYTFAEINSRFRLGLTDLWVIRQEIDMELLDYSADESVIAGYRRLRLLAMAGLEGESMSLLAGPQVEYLTQDETLLGDIEDYVEAGGKLSAEVFRLDQLFLTAESTTGWRNHFDEGEFWSDFVFERVSIVGSLQLPLGLTWDAFFSAEWEWHERDQDDSRLYLISTSLTKSW